MVQNSATRSPKIRQVDMWSCIVLFQPGSRLRIFFLIFMSRILLRSFSAYSRWITLKNKVFRSFYVILVHVIKNVLYTTLTPTLKVQMGSIKINEHHITRQNLMENPKKITVLCLENFYFWPNSILKKNDSYGWKCT